MGQHPPGDCEGIGTGMGGVQSGMRNVEKNPCVVEGEALLHRVLRFIMPWTARRVLRTPIQYVHLPPPPPV